MLEIQNSGFNEIRKGEVYVEINGMQRSKMDQYWDDI